ncbi:hypothetical protein RYX36_026229 [Vicia faba]
MVWFLFYSMAFVSNFLFLSLLIWGFQVLWFTFCVASTFCHQEMLLKTLGTLMLKLLIAVGCVESNCEWKLHFHLGQQVMMKRVGWYEERFQKEIFEGFFWQAMLPNMLEVSLSLNP